MKKIYRLIILSKNWFIIWALQEKKFLNYENNQV